MISWIVISILVIAGIFAIKLNHLKHRFFIILLIVLALFLYSSINYLDNNNSLDFSSFGGIIDATKVYFNWILNVFDNLKIITGNALKMNWSEINKTIFERR